MRSLAGYFSWYRSVQYNPVSFMIMQRAEGLRNRVVFPVGAGIYISLLHRVQTEFKPNTIFSLRGTWRFYLAAELLGCESDI
jgi:hypothetical protein